MGTDAGTYRQRIEANGDESMNQKFVAYQGQYEPWRTSANGVLFHKMERGEVLRSVVVL